MALNKWWFRSRLASAALLFAAALFVFAVSSGLAPCSRVFAQSTSCNVGDTEIFTGATEFQGVIEVGATPTAGTSGQYLVSQGSSAPPEWTNGPEPLVKAATETVNNSTTFQDDDELLFAVETNSKYKFEALVLIDSGATPDFKWQFTVPASALLRGQYSYASNVSGMFTESQSVMLSTDGTVQAFTLLAYVETAGTAGNVNFQWAQNTMDASDTQVLAGSFFVITELS